MNQEEPREESAEQARKPEASAERTAGGQADAAGQQYKKNMTIAVVVVVLLVIAGIVGWIVSSGGVGGLNIGGGEPAAIVNGEEISNKQFQGRLSQTLEGLEAQGAEVGEEQQEQVRQMVVNQLVNEELAAQYAAENDISVSQEEVDTRIQQVTEQLGGQEALQEQLSKQGISTGDLEEIVERELLNQKVVAAVSGGGDTEVTDQDVRDQYDQLKAQAGEGGNIPPFEQIESQLRAQLEQQAQSGNLSAAFDQLRQDAEVEVLI